MNIAGAVAGFLLAGAGKPAQRPAGTATLMAVGCQCQPGVDCGCGTHAKPAHRLLMAGIGYVAGSFLG